MFIFPKLTGTYAVGTKLFEIVDSTRNDPETGKPRELVVQAWYPTKEKPGVITAPYAYEAREWYKKSFTQQGIGEETIKLLDSIQTHATPNASVCNDKAPYPVVIFGHGNGAPRGFYSFLCEEIASHGYVVMMVMHTYVTFMTRFADGREITTIRDARVCTQIETCFADIKFMLDRAIAGDLGVLSTVCDFNNVAMAGHSLGGIMTAQSCRRDQRVKAGISLDAPLWGPNATLPFYKPFLFLRTPNLYDDMRGVLVYQKASLQEVGVTDKNFDESIERFCRQNGKDTVQIVVHGANHMTFSDDSIINSLSAQESIKRLSPSLQLSAVRECIMVFLNRYLKNVITPYPSFVQHDTGQEYFDFYIPDHNPKHKKIEISSVLLDAYIGQYRLGEVVFTITNDGNKLWAQLADQPTYPIYPESEITFFYTAVDVQISFVKDKNGNVTQLILCQGGKNQVAEKIE